MKLRNGSWTSVIACAVLLASGAASATQYKVLHNFGQGNDGYAPEAALVFDGSGNLYGTTVAGGSGCTHVGCGVVFKLVPNPDGSWSESISHYFNGSDGAGPYDAVTFDGSGNLYGTTKYAGAGGNGTVFELTPTANGGWNAVVLNAFRGELDGSQSYAGVTLDSSGHLYGTTSSGGSYAGGVAFSLGGRFRPGATVLHSFGSGNDGTQSFGSLISDRAGNLYGVTWAGGDYQSGAVFRLARDPISGSWTESVLYSFRGAPFDGSNPHAGVMLDPAGNLYGTTFWGGSNDFGTVFKLAPNADGSWRESVLLSFSGSNDGGSPYGGLTRDRFGNLYGTTNAGGPGHHGTVFRLAPMPNGQWTERVLHAFTGGVDGGWPGAGVILDGAGNIYGTAVMGGTGGPEEGGVVFEITP